MIVKMDAQPLGTLDLKRNVGLHHIQSQVCPGFMHFSLLFVIL
jgi:hypothetical protein